MSKFVTALKSYGQHFLTDKSVLEAISSIVDEHKTTEDLIEIGPGTGALTNLLIQKFPNLTVVEVDKRCVDFLNQNIKVKHPNFNIIEADFLKLDLKNILMQPTTIVGNFPYNISSQIIFKVLDNYQQVPIVVGMFQKEMAERIASTHGKKSYGVISIFTQLFYDVTIALDIAPKSFSPPPKVMSSVIILKRKENIQLDFDFSLFKSVVKMGFNQRRKMLRNALSSVTTKEFLQQDFFSKRAEQLSIQDFISLTKEIEQNQQKEKNL